MLLCIGEIYEKLDQPILAQKYYFKILEGQRKLARIVVKIRIGCSKQVLTAKQRKPQVKYSTIILGHRFLGQKSHTQELSARESQHQ